MLSGPVNMMHGVVCNMFALGQALSRLEKLYNSHDQSMSILKLTITLLKVLKIMRSDCTYRRYSYKIFQQPLKVFTRSVKIFKSQQCSFLRY